MIREIYSERQLLEVMTDFWFNHFNVYQYKDRDTYYTTAYERDVIRPHVLRQILRPACRHGAKPCNANVSR